MKRVFIALICVLSISLVGAQDAGAKIKFASTEHEFGNNPQGKPVSCEFAFTNVGTEPLVIESVKASCGCTTPDWTKEPVMPGKSGVVKAQYNMAREGSFRKSITVTTKAGETIVLYISGNAVAQTDGVESGNPTLIGK